MSKSDQNSPGGEGDDARKKRGNSQDERENSKKVRASDNSTRKDNHSKNNRGSCSGGDEKKEINTDNGGDREGSAPKDKEGCNGIKTLAIATATAATTTAILSIETTEPTSTPMAMADSDSDVKMVVKPITRHQQHAATAVTTMRKTTPVTAAAAATGARTSTTSSRSPNQDCQNSPKAEELQRHRAWDLESGLLYLAQIGSSRRCNTNAPTHQKIPANTLDTAIQNKSETVETSARIQKIDGKTTPSNADQSVDDDSGVVKEYLTKEEDSWITFRVAHAGDASSIAQLYRRQRSEDRLKRRRQKGAVADPSTEIRGESQGGEVEVAEEGVEKIDGHDEAGVEKIDDHDEAEIDKASGDRYRQEINNNDSNNNNSNNSTNNDERNESHNGVVVGEEETQHETNDEEEELLSSSTLQLEHWLAEGLGDENTCPSVHALLAYVHRSRNEETEIEMKKLGDDNDDTTHGNSPQATAAKLGSKTGFPTASRTNNDTDGPSSSSNSNHLFACVLLALSWTAGQRNLRIEWMSFDTSLSQSEDEGASMRQKVWLRIHLLSSMTACKGISIDEEILRSEALSSPSSPLAQQQQHRHHADRQLQSHPQPHGEEPLDGTRGTKPATGENHRVPHPEHKPEPSAE